MDPTQTGAPVSGQTFQNIPYNQRWDYLKDIIVDAFLGRNPPRPALKFKDLSEFMERNYAFSALPEDFRYRLRKWNIRKNTKENEKEAIVTAVAKRKRPGGSVSCVEIQQGDSMRPVDSKQLKRYLKDSIRHYTTSPLTPGMFSRWNLPYVAYRASVTRHSDHPSLFGHGPVTPQYLNVNSPEANSASQESGMTPTFAMVQQRTLLDRSNLLLQGRREDLLSMCDVGDRRIISDWLHDYWMYCFITVKFWGVGPQEWTAGIISQFRQSSLHSPFASSPATPAPDCPANESIRPEELCFCAIHLTDEEIDEFPESENGEEQAPFELHESSSWTPWPASERQHRSHQACMQEAFNHNLFSNIVPEEVAVSHDSILYAISKSPKELKLDSWAFAIMSGNRDLIKKLADEMNHEIGDSGRKENEFVKIHPYHLAASFLDGGTTCCHIMCDLTSALWCTHPIALNYLDSKGHTVLDSLIISVLRSHTNITPAEVSTSFVQCSRFPGEEKDICGRWDAHSSEVRHLYHTGRHRIPEDWKHNFCHSSVNAVCHSIMAIFMTPSRPCINTLSGLFRRRCRSVGCELKKEMQMGPLHTIVAVAFHLAENGKNGETLFGAIALLVCMLALGADTTLLADISVLDLFSSAERETCSHRSITAMELADQVPQSVIDGWTPSCKLGWRCMSLLLRRVTRMPYNEEFSPEFSNTSAFDDNVDDEDEDEDEIYSEGTSDCFWGSYHPFLSTPCSGRSLGLLWATIQTELLTCRRVSGDDPPISSNFDFMALLGWLEGATATFETGLVKDGLMKSHTSCGWFERRDGEMAPALTACEVSSSFIDLGAWTRALFVEQPKSYW